MPSDAAFMLACLQARPNQWVSNTELHDLSQAERGHGATWHSRASDLRNQGHTIENKVLRGWRGRAVSFYRYVTPMGEERPSLGEIKARVEIDEETGCWNWTGAKSSSGHGNIGRSRNGASKNYIVHRLAYEAARGPIQEGMVLHHECFNPACANPDHLRQVTPDEHRIIHTSAFSDADIHRFISQGLTVSQIRAEGVGRGRILRILRERSAADVPLRAAARDGNPGDPPGFPTAAAPSGTAAPLDQPALFDTEIREARKFVEGHAWEYQQRDAEQRRHG